MKRIALFISLILYFTDVFAQKVDKAYYDLTHRVMGKREVLLFPEDSTFILSLRSYGMSKGGGMDTLVASEGKLVGKYFEVSFTDDGIIMKHHQDVKMAKPKKFREYDSCDPFINLMMNRAYAYRRNNKANDIAYKKLGPMNKHWLERPKHEVELVNDESANSKNSIFSRTCHKEFKAIADSVFKKNIDLLEGIPETSNQN
jgi:hypothetical protein